LNDIGVFSGTQIGKFRDKPCAKGDYVWMNTDKFQIIYDKGVIITEVK